MRYRRAQILLWAHGSSCPSRLSLPGSFTQVRTYSAHPHPGPSPPPPPPSDPPAPDTKGGAEVVKERVLAALQHASELGRQWGRRSTQAASATMNYWWGRYEEFVGLNEVRDAQAKVTEGEAAFMVARGMVREAHDSLEALQMRLKEVRDRLDRVSREEAHYLELATLEHRLLQEERRLRTAYEGAEGAEREKFALFSAGVRESHEKERTRAERTKNWSVIGSVLGALIGVLGSTYINKVRLQELKMLLLEAQKGPESLQEALRLQAGHHHSQQAQLEALIHQLTGAVGDAFAQRDAALQGRAAHPPTVTPSTLKELRAGRRRAEALLEALPPQLGQLERGVGRVEEELQGLRKLLQGILAGTVPASQLLPAPTEGAGEAARREEEVLGREQEVLGRQEEVLGRRLEETQRTLGEQIRTNRLYHTVFTYSAAAISVCAVYLLVRGAG